MVLSLPSTSTSFIASELLMLKSSVFPSPLITQSISALLAKDVVAKSSVKVFVPPVTSTLTSEPLAP